MSVTMRERGSQAGHMYTYIDYILSNIDICIVFLDRYM